MTILRKARVEEASILSGLALKSKAHWDYSDDFIERCVESLTIEVSYIIDNYVYVLEKGETMIGFFSFIKEHGKNRLDFLYIHPDFIGKGYGTIIWSHVVDIAQELELDSFTIDSDPNARTFYEKMGAELIGETPSTAIGGRMLPLMKYELNK